MISPSKSTTTKTDDAAAGWLRRHRDSFLLWTVVLGSLAVGYVAYMLRRPFFYPDSRHYLAMAYWFGGESQESARDLTVEFGEHYGLPVPPVDTLFGWGLVQPRVVLPALAALPVRLFGPFGLAGTVLIILIAMTVVFTLILKRRFGNLVAASIMLLVNSCGYLMVFNGGMLTESLSALWSALTLIATWWWFARRRRWILVLLALTVIGAAFTRQATFITAGAFVVAWLLGSLIARRWNEWTIPALIVAATSLGCQILQTLLFPSFSQLDQFLKESEADNLGEALLNVPRMAANLLRNDVMAFLYSDVPMLLLMLLGIGCVVLHIKRPEAHLLIGAILGTALYNITNGTPTQFRYAIPGLIFWVLAAAMTLRTVTQHNEVIRTPSIGTSEHHPQRPPARNPVESQGS